MIILSPYCVAAGMVLAVFWALESVVCSDDDEEEPGNNGEDFVGKEIGFGEVFTFGEWIICGKMRWSA